MPGVGGAGEQVPSAGQTRVVWFVKGREDDTVVQCILVRRTGNVLAGLSVSLLRLSAPLADREGSCP